MIVSSEGAHEYQICRVCVSVPQPKHSIIGVHETLCVSIPSVVFSG